MNDTKYGVRSPGSSVLMTVGDGGLHEAEQFARDMVGEGKDVDVVKVVTVGTYKGRKVRAFDAGVLVPGEINEFCLNCERDIRYHFGSNYRCDPVVLGHPSYVFAGEGNPSYAAHPLGADKPFGCSSDCRAPKCGGGCSQ